MRSGISKKNLQGGGRRMQTASSPKHLNPRDGSFTKPDGKTSTQKKSKNKMIRKSRKKNRG